MELRQLRYFVRIIETGSMGSAAQDLDIGVSALSHRCHAWKTSSPSVCCSALREALRRLTPDWPFIPRPSLRCDMPTTRFSLPERRDFPVM